MGSGVTQMHCDMIGTQETHGFTLWGLSFIFQNALPGDSDGMTSRLAGGGSGVEDVYVCVVARS